MPAPTVSRNLLTVAAAVAALTVGGCGIVAGPTQTVTVTADPNPGSSAPGISADNDGKGSATTGAGTAPQDVHPDVHPLAGGPVPDGAIPLHVLHEADGAERSALQSPSGNIYCEFGRIAHGCGVKSYEAEEQYGSAELGPRWWFDLSSGERPAIDATGDPATELYLDQPPQVLDYGQIGYVGDNVCASEAEGLTCWNASTGHGVFMSRSGYQTF